MVTANVLRETFKLVVEAQKEGILFSTRFSDVLDTDNDKHLPECRWLPPQVGQVNDGMSRRQTFALDVLFVDNHEADRTTETMLGHFERMQVIAAQVLNYYTEIFVDQETTYQGVKVYLRQEGVANFTARWDGAGSMTTGCRLTVTFSCGVVFCSSDYFNTITALA